MPKCPSCNSGELSPTTVNYPIGDSLIKNVPVLFCSCGEVVLGEDVLSKIMAFLQLPEHAQVVEWGILNGSTGI